MKEGTTAAPKAGRPARNPQGGTTRSPRLLAAVLLAHCRLNTAQGHADTHLHFDLHDEGLLATAVQ